MFGSAPGKPRQLQEGNSIQPIDLSLVKQKLSLFAPIIKKCLEEINAAQILLYAENSGESKDMMVNVIIAQIKKPRINYKI